MFDAILFDLDGTLLNINMDHFLKHYFKKMVEMAVKCEYRNTEKLVKQIYNSTKAMIEDRNPYTTNEEVFMTDFFKNWCYPPEEFKSFFDKFYEKGFPQLKQYCCPFPGVPEMMAGLFAKNFRIVIATNAVFPLTALQQRLDWARIGQFNYELITSFEVMHFCKPHIEYYREIADKIGVKPEHCLMVGNDAKEDLPAGKIGMKTFLLENNLVNGKEAVLKPTWRGELKDLFHFMKHL